MDRKEVEALLAETRAYTGRKAGLIAALCRTQLAVWDAPVGFWSELGETEGMVTADDAAGRLPFHTLADCDRLALVRVPEGA